MTTIAQRPDASAVADPPMGRLWLLRDSWTEATRHLKALPRNPELLVFAALQPIMFVVLFVYVFGGSISVPGYSSYEQFVIPGIFAQTVLFGSIYTGLGIAEDLTKGFIDRLRSLPMYSSAMLLGRTISDVARNALSFIVMLVVAFIVGFRFEGSLAAAAAATLLLFLFAYAFSWVQAYTGLVAGSAEAVNSIAFLWMFVAVFVSSAFVAPENMPGWLQPIAEHNPVTIVTDASRALYNGRDPGSDPWIALAWAVGITIVFATLSIRRYRSATSSSISPHEPLPFAIVIERVHAWPTSRAAYIPGGKMRKHRRWVVALAVVAVVAAWGTSATAEGAPRAKKPSGEPIKLGVITGVQGGTISRPWVPESAEIAAAAVNAEGGIMGRPVEIVFCDHRGTPQDAAVCAQKLLVEDKVLMLVGGDGIQEGAVVPVLGTANTIAWAAGGASAAALASDREYMLQPILVNNWAIPQVLPKNVNKVAYVSADTEIARAGRERTSTFFPSSVTITKVDVPFTVTDFQPFCLQIQQAGAQAVITNFNSQQIPTMIQTCNQIGLKNLTWVVTSTVVTPQIVEMLTDLKQKNATVMAYNQKAYDGLKADIKKYKSKVGGVSNTIADDAISAWLGVRLLAKIIPQVGAVDAAQIKQYLDQQTALNTMGATPPIDFTATPYPPLPRIKNVSPWPAQFKNGQLVQTGTKPLKVDLETAQ